MSEGVLLVPGFFGFASFGRGDARISYFDHVAHAIQAARPEFKWRIDVSQPPPTGTRASRVQKLRNKMLDVLAHGSGQDAQRRPDRLHLVGHSTGGLDARLLVNETYDLVGTDHGKPHADQRSAFIGKLGTIATLSAP